MFGSFSFGEPIDFFFCIKIVVFLPFAEDLLELGELGTTTGFLLLSSCREDLLYLVLVGANFLPLNEGPLGEVFFRGETAALTDKTIFISSTSVPESDFFFSISKLISFFL